MSQFDLIKAITMTHTLTFIKINDLRNFIARNPREKELEKMFY